MRDVGMLLREGACLVFFCPFEEKAVAVALAMAGLPLLFAGASSSTPLLVL